MYTCTQAQSPIIMQPSQREVSTGNTSSICSELNHICTIPTENLLVSDFYQPPNSSEGQYNFHIPNTWTGNTKANITGLPAAAWQVPSTVGLFPAGPTHASLLH